MSNFLHTNCLYVFKFIILEQMIGKCNFAHPLLFINQPLIRQMSQKINVLIQFRFFFLRGEGNTQFKLTSQVAGSGRETETGSM